MFTTHTKSLHIKIKNPDLVANNQTLFITGILTILCLSAAVFGIYTAGSVSRAWQGFNSLLHEMCQEAPLFIGVFKILPFAIIFIFAAAIIERIKNNKNNAKKEQFTTIDFEQTGVLLTKSQKEVIFLPYNETSFEVKVLAQKITVGKNRQKVNAIAAVILTFRQDKITKIIHHHSWKPLVFLRELLPYRIFFSTFSLKVEPLYSNPSNQEAAEAIHIILQDYMDYGILIPYQKDKQHSILLLSVLFLLMGSIISMTMINILFIHIDIGWLLLLPGFLVLLLGGYFLYTYIRNQRLFNQLQRLKKGK